MIKIIILILNLAFIPSTVFALCPAAAPLFDAMEAMIDAFDQGNCSCSPVAGNNRDYYLAGRFCGPNGMAEAVAANKSPNTKYYKGTVLGCSVNTDAGFIFNIANQYTEQTLTCTYPYPQTGTYAHICYKVPVYAWVNSEDCSTGEKCYKVTGAASCSLQNVNASIVAFEVQQCDCQNGESIGGTEICGDPDAWEDISADYTGNSGVMVIYPNAACTLSQEDKDNLCESMEGTSTCINYDTVDTDGDGIPDKDDFCATPEAEINNVDTLGCTKQGGGDDDGDGVPDPFDSCVTRPNAPVDAFGCETTPDPYRDTDADGIPDEEDACPSETGNGVDGCMIPEDEKDSDGDGIPDKDDPDVVGDGDTDGPLMRGVIDWLRKVNSGIKDTNGKIQGLGGKIDSLGGKIDGVGNKIDGLGGKIDGLGDTLTDIKESLDASGVDTGLDSVADPVDDLPADYQAIDLEINFMTEIYDGLLNNNPFISAIRGTTLTTSGSCSINQSVSVLGHSANLNFSLCDYDLSMFRTMMILVSTLTAFFIVFRKG